MIKTIIFDLDGVLIESKKIHYEALNAALPKEFKISYDEHLSTYDGLPTKKKLNLLTTNKNLPSSLYKEIAKRKSQETSKILFKTIKPQKKLTKIFKTLKNKGYKIACASNSVRLTVNVALERLGVWYTNSNLILAHDLKSDKNYKINDQFLLQKGLWCHAKNFGALNYLKK